MKNIIVQGDPLSALINQLHRTSLKRGFSIRNKHHLFVSTTGFVDAFTPKSISRRNHRCKLSFFQDKSSLLVETPFEVIEAKHETKKEESS